MILPVEVNRSTAPNFLPVLDPRRILYFFLYPGEELLVFFPRAGSEEDLPFLSLVQDQ
jgi:hypothetical protein